jgi:hypothetical protein
MGTVVLADVSELQTKKISELTETITINRTAVLPIVSSGITKKIISPNLSKYGFWRSYEPFLDENYANVKGDPPQVSRGLFKGYKMPIWDSPQHQYDELVFRLRVPFRWDGVTNPYFCAITAISGTEDIGAKYKFQLEWASKDVEHVLPDTVTQTIFNEVIVTDGTAWRAEIIVGEMDASLDLVGGQNWQARLRRIESGSPAVVNDPVIFHWCTRWFMNRDGTETAMGY